MVKTLALLLTLISLAQEPASLGPLRVKTSVGRSAYVGLAVMKKEAILYLSADAAEPERREPLPLAFIVDGRRIELPPAERTRETGEVRRDVLQRWAAALKPEGLCEAKEGESLSIAAGELTFKFSAEQLAEMKELLTRSRFCATESDL